MTSDPFDRRLVSLHNILTAWRERAIGTKEALRRTGIETHSELREAARANGVIERPQPVLHEALARVLRAGRPVAIIVAHDRPLRDLEERSRLGVLSPGRRPALVADTVRAAIAGRPTTPASLALLHWIDGSARMVETPIRDVYERLLKSERSGEEPHATRGLLEANTTWILKRVRDLVPPPSTPVVLGDAARVFDFILGDGRRAFALSAEGWLAVLERTGLAAPIEGDGTRPAEEPR